MRGRLLHERYERLLSQYDNVIAVYKVEVGGLVGVVDLVIRRGGRLIPVEVKTGAGRRAHRLQLQVYISMLKARFGYLVYRDGVEVVEGDGSALEVLGELRRAMESEEPPPPPPPEKCGRCPFRAVCAGVAGRQ